MSKMTQAKKSQLVRLGITCAAALAAGYFLLIQPQLGRIEAAERQFEENQAEMRIARQGARLNQEMQADLRLASRRLESVENHMAVGDVYFWMVKTLEGMEKDHAIRFSAIEPPRIEESNLIPRVPYPEARFTITGRATYHDFGQFLAEFENRHPFINFHRIELESVTFGKTLAGSTEELRIRMELSTLVRPSPATKL